MKNNWTELIVGGHPTMVGLLSHIGVADAIGEPLEFESNLLNSRFDASMHRAVLNVSDDTQMALFLAEALAQHKGGSAVPLLRQGYINWYKTQVLGAADPKATGLLSCAELYVRRAPGHTCINSSRAMSDGDACGVNNSKGNGGVMRIAPMALWAWEHGITCVELMDLAEKDTKLTHSHPAAASSVRFLVGLYYHLLEGATLAEAVEFMYPRFRVQGRKDGDDCLSAISRYNSTDDVPRLDMSCGGWTADEAVVLAVQSVLAAKDYIGAIRRAATIQGDSDTVAAIAGALAYFAGMRAPEDLCDKLDVIRPIRYVHTLHN